jgi:hypothetical protein
MKRFRNWLAGRIYQLSYAAESTGERWRDRLINWSKKIEIPEPPCACGSCIECMARKDADRLSGSEAFQQYVNRPSPFLELIETCERAIGECDRMA